MHYALIFYTHLENESLNEFRRKYDPWCNLIEDHMALVFPTPDSIGLFSLIDHVENVLAAIEPFDIHISGLTKSWDHFLLLTLKEGNEKVTALFEHLYSGILAPYKREDLKYIPHIGIGFFVNTDSYHILDPKELPLDEPLFNKAWKEAEDLHLDFWRKVDKLNLIKFNEDFTSYWDIHEFTIK